MSTSPGQFTGTPLVAGDVMGVRAWNVDTLGRIKSPSYSHIWTPGENAAECQKDRAISAATISWSRPRYYFTLPTWPGSALYGYASNDEGRESKNVDDYRTFATRLFPGWTLLSVEFESKTDFFELTLEKTKTRAGKRTRRPESRTERLPGEQVRAAVETSGINPRIEPPIPEPEPEPVHDFSTCTCGFYAYMNGTNDYADQNVIGVIQGYGETFLGTRGFRSSKARIVAAYASTHADVERVRPLPVSMDRMRELYPDVAWFHDYAAMVAEFPPSDPEPTPDTDDNFWTRSA